MRQPFPFHTDPFPSNGKTANDIFEELRREDEDARAILQRCKMTWAAVLVAFLWGCATQGAPTPRASGPKPQAPPETAMFLPSSDLPQDGKASGLADCEEACTLAMERGFAGDPDCAQILLQASSQGWLLAGNGTHVTCRQLVDAVKLDVEPQPYEMKKTP